MLDNEDKKFITQTIAEAVSQAVAPLATRENVYDMETKLLTAFRVWASPVESKIRAFSAVLQDFDVQLEAVKTRLAALESQPRQ